MEGKHEETILGRNARWLESLMREILELTYQGQPIAVETAEMALRCAESVRDEIIHMGA